jgi:hypothetical protein
MVVIVWQLDLQLSVPSVPITTKIVSWKPVYGEVYSIQHYVIQFIIDIVESGVKHHQPPTLFNFHYQ